MSYRSTPFLRLVVPFVAGLSLAGWHPHPVPLTELLLGLAGLLLLVLAFYRYPYRRRWLFGTVLAVFLVLAGFVRMQGYSDLRQPGHFHAQPGPSAVRAFTGMVDEAPSRGKRLRVPVRLTACADTSGRWQTVTGRVLLLVREDSAAAGLRYGDFLVVSADIVPVPAPTNPHAFDYGRYLRYQNLHYQSFVESGRMQVYKRGGGWPWWRVAYHFRDRLLLLLQHYFPDVDAYAVAAALLVGYKDDLSDDLKAAYVETGSMHALAVSGTHVGFLYTGLLLLLSRLPWRTRTGHWFRTLLILAAIWGFTLLTGATASVLRASVMFSFYLVGKALHRDASVWNILAASAFFLLWHNPYLLFDAGFQLSYAAVAGMVSVYPSLRKRSPVLPRGIDEGWQVLLVGVAAQAGTLPLSLYYFHQFPSYFWLAGWVVVLGGAVFLWGGALLVLLDVLAPVLAQYLGALLYGLVWVMNRLILLIQRLPGAVLEGIWLPGWGAVLLAIAVFCGVIALERRHRGWLAGGLLVLTLLGAGRTVQTRRQLQQRRMVVYDVHRSRLIDFLYGGRAVSLSDSLPERQVKFAAEANRLACGIAEIREISFDRDTLCAGTALCYQRPLLYFDGHIVALPDQPDVRGDPAPPVAVEVLILSGQVRASIAECAARFPFRIVVFDRSCRRGQVVRWKTECRSLGLPFHDIAEQGAFISDFSKN